MDGPEHTRMRAVLRETIMALEPFPDAVRAGIDDVVAGLGPEFDLVADFARPVAAEVTGTLLGTALDASFLGHLEAVTGNLDVWLKGTADKAAQTSALRVAMLLRRSTPTPGRGLWLLRAARDAGRITDEELVLTPVALAHAAYENSLNLLALAGLALARDPALAGRFRATADTTPLVRELTARIRPARFVMRRTTEPVDLPGVTLAPGTRVAVSLGEPSAGLPFGLGPHACPGSSVAIAEADIALCALARVLAGGCTVSDVHEKSHLAFHGLASATVRIHA
jgi:cytochrome P450